ncbi:hypothetical protein [Halorussus salinus]|uniref:hypothetical protein n=1 Tax=Halorussus salinus TaxID=1364935 RepID=UPI001092A519|nr:hypothetical protein [Halorussus salinus]
MRTAETRPDSWLWATVDVFLAFVGFVVVFYPLVTFGNEILGFPVTQSTVNLVVAVLALGGAYPVVAGDWSLGRLGEFTFVLVASAMVTAVAAMIFMVASGTQLASDTLLFRVAVWGLAYLLAYVVYRTNVSVLT